MSVSKTWRLALVVLVLGVIAAGPVTAAEGGNLVPTKVVNATKDDLSPGRTYSAPALAADPSNPKTIVGGFIEFRTRSCGLIRSTDGGKSWKILDSQPDLKSYPYCLANNSNIFHAPVAFGRDGTLYLATHAWDTPDSRNKVGVQLAKSTDLGDHWTTVLARDARPTQGDTQELDRPITGFLVDTKHGSKDILYITLRQGWPNTTAPNTRIQQPVVLISKDAGATWAPPVVITGSYFNDNKDKVNNALSARTTIPGTTTTTAVAGSLGENPANPANYGSAGNGQGFVMDDKGTLYYGWMTASANVTPSVPSSIVLSKSTDQGKSWSSSQVRPPSYENAQNVRMAWTPGGGPNGTLHMVWEWRNPPTVANYADVGYIRSTDGGKTWSDPKRLADDKQTDYAGKYLPNLQVAPNGRLDAVWWDTRDDPGVRANEVYYSYSNDDGKTWSKNFRITDQGIDRRFGVYGNNFDQNSPPGLLSANQYAMFAWDDTRFSRSEDGALSAKDPVAGDGLGIGGGVQDIFTSAVQFEAIGSGGSSKTAKIIFAGVIGLLAVGLALTLVALMSKRGAGGATGAPAKKATTKAGASK